MIHDDSVSDPWHHDRSPSPGPMIRPGRRGRGPGRRVAAAAGRRRGAGAAADHHASHGARNQWVTAVPGHTATVTFKLAVSPRDAGGRHGDSSEPEPDSEWHVTCSIKHKLEGGAAA
jgi:hypothetical protein